MLTIETLYLKFEISKIQLNQYIKMKEVPEKGEKKTFIHHEGRHVVYLTD